MPRPRREYMAGYTYHIVQRGVDRQPCFREPLDRLHYQDCLLEALIRYGVSLHAYVLMGNHVHFLMTPGSSVGISRLMGVVGNRYVSYFNNRYGRTGTLFEGRHRSCMIDSESYLMRCYRYIDLNPVRAGIVDKPDSYYWCSYGFNALGAFSELVTPHELYRSLAGSGPSRQQAYLKLCQQGLAEWELAEIRNATRSGSTLVHEPRSLPVEQRYDTR